MLNNLSATLCLTASSLALASATPAIAQRLLTPTEAAAAFGAREKIIDASISPAGDQVAIIIPGKGQSTLLAVTQLATGKSEVISSADGNPLSLSSCGWVSNSRLVCIHYGISSMEGQMLAYSRLAALDSNGQNVVPLGARERVQHYAQQSDGYVIDWLDGSSNKVLMARNYVPAKGTANSIGSIYDGLGVDVMDTRTGKVDHVEMADRATQFYLSDGAGNVRIKAIDVNQKLDWQSGSELSFSYRPAGNKGWKPFSVYSRVTDEGLYPIAVDAASNTAYSLKKTNGRDAVYRTKLDGSLTTELVFAHPQVDVTGIVRAGRNGKVVGASYATDKRETVYFDPEYKKLGDGLSKAIAHLPLIRFVDSSTDGGKQIIYASSDVNPGQYFLYDAATRQMELLVPSRPELQNVTLSTVKPIAYRAADGTMVPGYLTLPLGSDGKNLPAIVMPHGGPAARDEWGFDWWAQYYANRGFAVLQPNFRGSSGYGDGWFQKNGFKSWKAAIGDVNDAGKWLVSQGIADAGKLAIVGWSYGGYAALQANVVDPDLFKAIVAVAPVTDLDMLRDEQVGFTNMRLARDYIGSGPHIQEGSPARHAAKFKAPVLMFHGDKDINVSVKEARVMDSALRKADKKSELIVYKGIDHQLDDSDIRIDMLTKSEAFLR
ncbi:MAG: S9 family peptidase, partial [Pseudomonadota bacterium]|nr:S9 family peptidase [Pseudomonadota bacterium]